MAFVALFDANVLYPGSLRGLVIRLGQTGLFRARWTEQILDETFNAIIRSQPELAGRLERTRELMNNAIDDVGRKVFGCGEPFAHSGVKS